MHILGTLDRADGGELFLNRVNVASLKNSSLARFRNRHIGFIFQNHNLLPEFTALENICIPAFIGKQDEQSSRIKALELLKLLGLEERAMMTSSQKRLNNEDSLFNIQGRYFIDPGKSLRKFQLL